MFHASNLTLPVFTVIIHPVDAETEYINFSLIEYGLAGI